MFLFGLSVVTYLQSLYFFIILDCALHNITFCMPDVQKQTFHNA